MKYLLIATAACSAVALFFSWPSTQTYINTLSAGQTNSTAASSVPQLTQYARFSELTVGANMHSTVVYESAASNEAEDTLPIYFFEWELLQKGQLKPSLVDSFLEETDYQKLLKLFKSSSNIGEVELVHYVDQHAALQMLTREWARSESLGAEEASGELTVVDQAIPLAQIPLAKKTIEPSAKFIFIAYRVPEAYLYDFVYIKWLSVDHKLWKMDRYKLTGTAVEVQQAWLRRNNDWPEGRYRIKIFGADEGLPLLASRDYEVVAQP